MNIQADTQDGLRALRVSGQDLAATVLPGLGAKISSLRWRDVELLAQNPQKPFKPARYAAVYAEFDASGFDECLPTIGPCLYPEAPWAGVEAPDHGEVWSIPWDWETQPEALHLRCRGVRFPYDFHKSLSMPVPGCLRLDYELVNRAEAVFKFLWSAHPLLALQPGMRICLPPGVGVRVDWSKDERLGRPLDQHAWPITHDHNGQAVDLSLILPEHVHLVDKLYTTRLEEGWCVLHDPKTGRYVAFLFSPGEIPFVGLSINLGGWPLNGPGYYNLGLEPCRGYPDRLDRAVTSGDYVTTQPGQRLTWTMDMCVGLTDDLPTEIKRLRAAQLPATSLTSEAAE